MYVSSAFSLDASGSSVNINDFRFMGVVSFVLGIHSGRDYSAASPPFTLYLLYIILTFYTFIIPGVAGQQSYASCDDEQRAVAMCD